MIKDLKSRLSAFSIHLSLSVIIFLIFFYLVFAWWYPEPYLSIEGGWSIVALIVLIDVILGPSLTFVVFKPGKKGLALDLSLIAGVQICALVYGITVIYTERPQFLVFSVDRFVMVSPNDVEQDKFQFKELIASKGPGPLPVFARSPEDPVEKKKLLGEVFSGKPDLDFRAEYYEPIESHWNAMLAKSKAIEVFREISDEYRQTIDAFMTDNCQIPDNCVYFPVVGKEKTMLLAMQRDNGKVVGAMDIDPWLSEKAPKRVKKASTGERRV